MKQIFSQLLCLVMVSGAAHAEDMILFKNGDVLTGKVLEQNEEQVRFSSEPIGTVTLERSNIKVVLTEDPPPETQATPAEPPVSAPETVQPKARPEPQKTDLAEQDSESTPAPPAKKKGKWSGQAGLAIAMRERSQSNASGVYREDEFRTYRVYGNVDWKSERNRIGWNWTYRYSEDETRTRDDFFNVTQKYNHFFSERYYGEAKTVYQRDYNRNIDNEYLQTAEIGRKWFQQSRFSFSTSIGGGYHYYERSSTGDTIETSEPKFIFDESLEWKLISSLKLFQRYTHLGDLEAYHFVFSSGLENTLLQDLFLRLEYRLDRDTDTTYDDKGYYDKALLTSLLYKF